VPRLDNNGGGIHGKVAEPFEPPQPRAPASFTPRPDCSPRADADQHDGQYCRANSTTGFAPEAARCLPRLRKHADPLPVNMPCPPHLARRMCCRPPRRLPSFLLSRPVVAVTWCVAIRRQRALRSSQAAPLPVSPALGRVHSLSVRLVRPRCCPSCLCLRGPSAAVRRRLSPFGRRWGALTLCPFGAGASPLLPVFSMPPLSLRGAWGAPFPARQALVCLPCFPCGAGISPLLPVARCWFASAVPSWRQRGVPPRLAGSCAPPFSFHSAAASPLLAFVAMTPRSLGGGKAASLPVWPALARPHPLSFLLLRPRCCPLWLCLRGPLAAGRRRLFPSGRRWGAPALVPFGAGASPLLPVFSLPPPSLRGFWVAPFPAQQALVCLPFSSAPGRLYSC